jgi:tetratricopeptide (TPR) repeat protein
MQGFGTMGRQPIRIPLTIWTTALALTTSLSRPAYMLALALTALPASAHQTAELPADGDWIGKRVVQRDRDFQLRVQKQIVDRKGVLTTYRVEQVSGQWLWLRADGIAGWARIDAVVAADQAIAFYTDYIRDHPGDAYGYSMRGTIWLEEKKDVDAALRDYTEAIRLAPTVAGLLVNRGNAWAARKEYDKAIADYDEVIRLQPEEAFAYSGRGLAWFAKKEFDKAIADLSEAIMLDPELVIAYNGRGLAWKRKGDFDKAIADFNEAIRLYPQNSRAFEHRGFALYDKGDYDKAIADFDAAIGMDSRDFVAYLGRGCAWHWKNEYTKAIADFDEAIRLDPQHVKAYIYRASAWYRKTEYDQAIRDYTEAIRLDPTLAGVYVDRGDARRDKGEWANAAADYAEAIRLESNLAGAYDGQAWIWAASPDAKHRDGKRAVESATKSCELTGWKVPNNLDTLAAACAENGDFMSAVKWQARAVALATDEDDTAAYASRLKLYRTKKPYRLDMP